MIRYVLGFAFNAGRVLVIRHDHGPCEGKLNGLGGKIEEGEHSANAMTREFEEEAGVTTPRERWSKFAEVEARDGSYKIYCYRTDLSDDEAAACHSAADEPVEWVEDYRLSGHGQLPVADHVPWLIALAREPRARLSTPVYVTD